MFTPKPVRKEGGEQGLAEFRRLSGWGHSSCPSPGSFLEQHFEVVRGSTLVQDSRGPFERDACLM